jgi:hypothetical protein
MARVPYNAGDKGGSTDIRNTDNLAAALNDPDFDSIEIDDVEITATAAEINNACDVSTRIVTIADATNTLALTAATHANRICLIMDATLATTLPEATGTGDRYTLVQGIASTASTIVTADTSNAGFRGMLNAFDSDDESTLTSWPAAPGGGDDTITFNGVATGGKIYDHFSFLDIATDVWLVSGQITQSGGSEVTPFSSAA